MNNSLFPWQREVWRQLQSMRSRLPHALLFHGPAGIGKTLFAERFAQALLCQAPIVDGEPCGQCASCGWFVQYSHPDYRRVRPEALEQDGGEPAEEEGEGGKSGKARALSKEIKIDQIRALADFMNVSTHRQGMRVVLLYPAEALNTAAANALLKTLEEPPADTVFLLVSDNPDRLLPTILSRCRQFALALPPREQALEWLTQQGVAEAETWLAEQGGAPLRALAVAQAGNPEALQALLEMLAGPGREAAVKAAERLQKTPVIDLVAWLQRWLYDLFSLKTADRIRYYPRYRKELAALAGRADTGTLLGVLKRLNERRAIAEHPLAARLFIEDMLLDYAGLFSGRENASRGA